MTAYMLARSLTMPKRRSTGARSLKKVPHVDPVEQARSQLKRLEMQEHEIVMLILDTSATNASLGYVNVSQDKKNAEKVVALHASINAKQAELDALVKGGSRGADARRE